METSIEFRIGDVFNQNQSKEGLAPQQHHLDGFVELYLKPLENEIRSVNFEKLKFLDSYFVGVGSTMVAHQEGHQKAKDIIPMEEEIFSAVLYLLLARPGLTKKYLNIELERVDINTNGHGCPYVLRANIQGKKIGFLIYWHVNKWWIDAKDETVHIAYMNKYYRFLF